MNYLLIFILIIIYTYCLYYKYEEENGKKIEENKKLKRDILEVNKKYQRLYNERNYNTSYTYDDNTTSIYNSTTSNPLVYNNTTSNINNLSNVESYTQQEISDML